MKGKTRFIFSILLIAALLSAILPAYSMQALTAEDINTWVALHPDSYITVHSSAPAAEFLAADLSSWQNPSEVDYVKLKENGIRAVILRIGGRYYNSTGTASIFEDDAFPAHYAAAKAAGLAVGCYFYSYALTTEGAIEEANFCIERIKNGGYLLDMPIFIDMEEYSGTYVHYNAGKAVCSNVIDVFCSTMEASDFYAGLYVNTSFAETTVDEACVENRPVWIAEYSTECSYKGRYDMWQYTNTGSVPGFAHNLDLDKCYRDFPTYIRKNGLNGYEKAPDDETQHSGHTAGAWLTIAEANCTANGVRRKFCTDSNCGMLLQEEATAPLGHSVATAFVASQLLSAGNSTATIHGNTFDLSVAANIPPAFEAAKASGGSAISYCTVCNTILQSCQYAANHGCDHTGAMPISRYQTRGNIFFRSGPATSYSNISDSNGESVLIPTSTIVQVLRTFGNWGYFLYNGSYGWMILDYSTFLSTSNPASTSIQRYATCTQDGLYRCSCTACGANAFSSFTSATGHTAGSTVITAGSCLYYGSSTKHCTTCSTTLSYLVTRIGEHQYTKSIQRYPTATTNGTMTLQCSVCNKKATVSPPSLSMYDADGDGSITSGDARMALRFSVGMDSQALTTEIRRRTDVDNDGSITAADARNLLRISVSLENEDELLILYYPL